jgi:hypothetical protein
MKTLHLALATLALLAAMAPATRAGRGVPEPVLKQFEEGYGVVAAEKSPDSTERGSDGTYGVTFRAIKVVGETVRIHPRLGLKAGDLFNMLIAVGYGRPVERFGEWDANGNPLGERIPFAPGARFYLTIRPSNFGTFEHARGADAAIRVQRFDDNSDTRFARLRAVADMPFDRRWDETLSIAANPKEDHDLRQQALQYFAQYFIGNGLPGEEYVDRAAQRFRAMWRAPQSTFAADDLFRSLDRALAKFAWADFAKSPERREKWFDRIFQPPPAGAAHDPVRLKQRRDLSYMLAQFAQDDPAGVGARIIAELRGDKWPATFRNHLAGLLLRMQLETRTPEPEWEPELQTAFARLSVDLSDPQDFRMMSGTLHYAATAEIRPSYEGGVNRHFILREASRTALAARVASLHAHAKPGDPDQSDLASQELDGALAAQKAAAANAK